MSKFLTPLRYPGGKSRFSHIIQSIVQKNNLTGGHYLEPYSGGAAVGLFLLNSNLCSEIHLNDIDHSIYSFWHSTLRETEAFIEKIEKTPITIDQWHKQKKIYDNADKSNYSLLEVGFSALFLNRTNHSGILKAGVIGGKEQLGTYKIDARFNKKTIINRIKKIALLSSRIHLYCEDANTLLSKAISILPPASLVYLDPPYYLKGKGLYRNFYTHQDHVNIRDTLKKTPLNWVVSYDNHPEIRNIYKDFVIGEYNLSYSASNTRRRLATELIILSRGLTPPELDAIRF